MKVFNMLVLMSFILGCLAWGGCGSDPSDISGNENTAGDADTDTDGDADTDIDGDADTDTDGDADTDTDGDTDTDTDGDAGTSTPPSVAVYVSYSTSSKEYFTFANNESGIWEIEESEIRGDRSSLAFNSNGKARVGYGSYSYNINRGLPKISRGPLCLRKDQGWKSIIAGTSGVFPSLAIDSSDNVHMVYKEEQPIPYYNAICSFPGSLMYSTNKNGQWQWSKIEDVYAEGCTLSMGLDNSDSIHVSYFSYSNECLAYVTNSTGAWVETMIDSDPDPDIYIGIHNDLALDSQGNVHIGYNYAVGDGTGPTINTLSKELRYTTNKSGEWVTATLDTGYLLGHDLSIAVDSNDYVHIVYIIKHRQENDDHRTAIGYVTNASGAWEIVELETEDVMADSPSIALDSMDKLHIVYAAFLESDPAQHRLRYATNMSGDWAASTIDDITYYSYPSIALKE